MRKTCCFTGHRPDKLFKSDEEIKALVKIEAEKAIAEGFGSFISGMAQGFDILAAEAVAEMCGAYPDLKIVCAVPYDGFERKRSFDERKRYESILRKAAEVHILAPKYAYSCFQYRNMWMVDRSQRVIAAYCGQKGGTRNTIEYARKNKKEVVNIFGDIPE